jgi:hypothetical protein
MKRLFTMASLLLGLAGSCWAETATTDPIKAEDAAAIHQVVQSQLEALSKDDAAGAFELATPEKRTLIGDADSFLRLIKEEYNPIYRFQQAIFSAPARVDGDAIQVVRVTDSASRVWLAVFWMQQGEDQSWKIDGCELLPTEAVSV